MRRISARRNGRRRGSGQNRERPRAVKCPRPWRESPLRGHAGRSRCAHRRHVRTRSRERPAHHGIRRQIHASRCGHDEVVAIVHAMRGRLRVPSRSARCRRDAAAQAALPVDSIGCRRDSRSRSSRACPNARAMTWGADGHAVRRLDARRKGVRGDAARAGAAASASVRVIASGLREPAGVAFRDGALYVSAIVPHPALRRHRAPSRRSADAGGRHRHASRPTGTTAASSSRSDRTASST